jgi:hypothetical protein
VAVPSRQFSPSFQVPHSEELDAVPELTFTHQPPLVRPAVSALPSPSESPTRGREKCGPGGEISAGG